MKQKTVNFSIVLLLLILILQTIPLNAVYAESPEGESGETSLQQVPASEEKKEPLSDGTYEAIVKTDSSMFRVTEAKLLVKEGKMTGIFTLAGSGFDRLYLGKADGKVSLSDGETIGYKSFDGKKYTFWPVEFDEFDQDYQISARSYKKRRWYQHTFRVQKEGIRKISDDVQYMTSQDEADKYMENLRKRGNIMLMNADSIKKDGTRYTFPYFNQEMKPIDIFKLVSPSPGLLKYRYDIEDSGKYIRKSRVSQNKYWLYPRKNVEESFKVTLNLFDPGADPAAIRGGEIEPLAKETFTFVLEPAPKNLGLSFKVLDKKSGLPVEEAKVVVKDSAGKEVEAENGTYNLQGGVKYSLEISADGYISTEGEDILRDLLAPSQSEEKTYYLIKKDEGLHRVSFKAVGDDGKAPENLEINLYNGSKKLTTEEDGSYTLVDGKAYRVQASADFYKSFAEDMTFEEDKNVTITLQALSQTFKLKVDTNVESYTVKMYMQEDGKKEVEVHAEEDGGFIVKRRARIRYVVTADGYEPAEIRLEKGFFAGESNELTQYIGLNETPRRRLSKEIAKLKIFLDEVIEGEKPGNYPVGTGKLLEDAISAAEKLVEDADTPDERLEEESDAIGKLITDIRKSQIAEENLVHFIIRDGAGKPAYRKDVIVPAGMCAKYGFRKAGSKQKKTTVLDGILALHENLYGEEFQRDPKAFFDMPMMVKKIFAVNPKSFSVGFAVNNVICDYINIDDKNLKQDDYVDIFYSADKDIKKSNILSFDNPEYSTEVNKSLQVGLWYQSAFPVFSDEKAETADGYKVVFENIETKTRVEVLSSGDKKNLSLNFKEPGQYVVKEVSKEGEADIIYPYCLIKVKDAAKKPEESEKPGDNKDQEKPSKPEDNENAQELGGPNDNKDPEKPHKPGNDKEQENMQKPEKPLIVPGDGAKTTYHLIEVDGEKWKEGGKIIWKKGSKDGLELRIDGDYSGFRGITLDGRDPDKGKYSVGPGSTVIKLEPDMLESLKLGEHKLVASYDDGSLGISFTVAAAEGSTKPDTGERPDLITYLILMVLTVSLIGLLLGRLKKTR